MAEALSHPPDVLRDLGLRLPDRSMFEMLVDSKDLQSSLRLLSTAWQQVRNRTKSPRLKRDAEHQSELVAQCEHQLAESWQTDDSRIPRLVRSWLGFRRWWWSGEFPTKRRVAIVSSRLSRQIDTWGSWLQGLRASLSRISEHDCVGVVSQGVAGQELILRGIVRTGAPAILLKCCNAAKQEDWCAHWSAGPLQRDIVDVTEAWALPEVRNGSEPHRTLELSEIPERDRAAVAWSDEIIVLGLRPHGNLEALLRRRLELNPQGVLLVDLPGLQPPRLQAELMKLGAVRWLPDNPQSLQRGNAAAVMAIARETRSARVETDVVPTGDNSSTVSRAVPQDQQDWQRSRTLATLPQEEAWEYLIHSTRACCGPWPGQKREEYLDNLLDAHPDSDQSPLGALLRILRQRRLCASNQAIRGGFSVVSFTAVPLRHLHELRVYRSHRSRWDFEPYGICIRREWLEQRGARQVKYGHDLDWKSLSNADRPYFQLASSKPRREPRIQAERSIDWTTEREWRLLGDLNLDELQHPDAFVFVPTAEYEQELLEVSPWPVILLDSLEYNRSQEIT